MDLPPKLRPYFNAFSFKEVLHFYFIIIFNLSLFDFKKTKYSISSVHICQTLSSAYNDSKR